MDHIHKFIARRPSKNHRIIEYKNATYSITKPDINALHRYKHGQCLTTLNLYAPLQTKWSSIKQEKPLNTRKKPALSIKRSLARFKEKIQNYKAKEYKNVNEILDIWDNEDLDLNDTEHKIMFNRIVDDKIEGPFMDLKSQDLDVKGLMKKISDEFFVPYKKVVNFESLLPSGRVDENAMFVGKYYVFESKILDFMIFEDEFVVLYSESFEVYEFRNKRLLFANKLEITASKIQLTENLVILSYLNNIKIIARGDKKDRKIPILGAHENLNIRYELDIVVITCRDKIRDFDFSGDIISFISNRNVFYINTESQKIQTLKFKTENPLNIKIKNNLYVSTTNGFYIYDMIEDNYIQKAVGLFSYIHSFSTNENFSVICDRSSRITIYNKGVKNVLEQKDYVKSVVLHDEENNLLVRFKENVYVFCVSEIDNYQCSIIGKIEGKFKKVEYSKDKSWVYACKKNKLFLYM